MSEVRKHMIFHGRVQGVGFRYTAKYLARSMNLTGWVKNEYDGTVVMEVQGSETLIFELMKGLAVSECGVEFQILPVGDAGRFAVTEHQRIDEGRVLQRGIVA